MANRDDVHNYRNDPTDPYAPTGVRPHEMGASRPGAGRAVAIVLGLLFLVIVLLAMFAGGPETGSAIDTAPAVTDQGGTAGTAAPPGEPVAPAAPEPVE